MKIVIKIPEDVYTRLFDKGIQDNEIATDDICEMARALRLGTPLPEHHGRLIDADELKSMSYEVLVDTDNPNRSDGLSACNGLVEDDIDLAPTIIEADKCTYKETGCGSCKRQLDCPIEAEEE